MISVAEFIEILHIIEVDEMGEKKNHNNKLVSLHTVLKHFFLNTI